MVDKKLFKKAYKYICTNCGEFAHTLNEYCEICGTKDALREAKKEDYRKKFGD